MQSENHTGASMPRRPGDSARLPGGWAAVAIAALSALLAGYLGRPNSNAPPTEGNPDVSRVAEVVAADLPVASGTLSGTPEELARIAARDTCSRRLAVVTVARSPGRPRGRIRLRSGNYISPAFELADTPVRVAIPFPAPYPVGHGALSVLGTTTDAIVALTPPWHVSAHAGMDAHEVTWAPAAGCRTGDE